MKKIIYNTKLKKLIVSMLLFVLLLNFVFPSMVFAATISIEALRRVAIDGNTASGTIQDVMWSMRTEPGAGVGTVAGLIYTATTGEWVRATDTDIRDFERDVKEKIANCMEEKGYSDTEIEQHQDKVYHYNKDNSAIKVTVKVVRSGESGIDVTSVEIDVNQIDITTPMGMESVDDRVDTKAYKINDDGTIVEVRTDAQGDNIEDPEHLADVGGILLSPVFYLVNFIADAITSNLGAIMIGDDASFGSVTGTKVLQADPIQPDANSAYYDYPVESESFEILGTIQYPNIQYTPEEIFAGKVDLLSIDFISGNNYEGQPNTSQGWQDIRYVISEWYKVIRMIAIIGLLSVLIYTGVKIIISANAKDKAKYKEWIINWFIAVAILFFMHYIMAFIISVTGELSKLISNASQQIKIVDHRGTESVTNLMGLVRFMIQSEDFYTKVGYEVMYIALLVYTIKFTFVYLKRVLNMAFLTLIAPIVALTYPIDKLNDGQAQGFNMWLKEYIFNALLQPMHCIMYYILVGAAVGIAASNPIYGIVVLAFMAEAEKLLKRIFGFDKAGGGTVGGMAGAFAAGAIASSVKDIARMAKLPGGNAGKGSGGSSGSDSNGIYDNPKPIGDKLDVVNDFKETEGSNAGGGTSGGGTSGGGSAGVQTASTTRTGLPGANNNTHQSDSTLNGNSSEGPESMYSSENDFYEQQRSNLLDMGMSEEDVDREMMEQYGATGRSYPTPDAMYSSENDFYEQQRDNLLDMGMSDEEADREMMEQYGFTGRDNDNGNNQSNFSQQVQQPQVQARQVQQPVQSPTPSNSPQTHNSSSGLQKFKKGSKAVWKQIKKPIWDDDHTKKYNRKRLLTKTLKTAGKAALGFSLGTAAAAVQAGISITDGKYNPMEGMATFTAGAVGGGKIVNAIGSGAKNIYDTYQEGTLPDDPGKRKEEIMKRAQERFPDREDVIQFNKNEYRSEERESRTDRERKHYLTNGYADLKKMKSGMKYADSILKAKGIDMKTLTKEQQMEKMEEMKKADEEAIKSMKFIDMLESQGQSEAINNMELQRNYIAAKTQGIDDADKVRKITAAYNNAFRSARAFYDAQ